MKKRDSSCINFTLGMHAVSHFSFFFSRVCLYHEKGLISVLVSENASFLFSELFLKLT